MSTYDEQAQLVSSRKYLLAQIEPSSQLTVFTNVSGSIWKKTTNYYIVRIKQNDTTLTEVSSSSLLSGQWFFDNTTKELFVRMTDDSDPNANFISAFNRLFFSNIDISLTHDLTDAGKYVNYEARVQGVGAFSQKLDEEATGVALETSSNVRLFNNDGFFDDIYDTLVWENKRVRIYSYLDGTLPSEARILFDGIIESKTFSSQTISFRVKDLLYQLREPVPLTLFADADGVSGDVIGTPKRLLFGEVEGLSLVPTDPILDGFSLAGTVSGNNGSTTLTGIGTSFLEEVSPEDTIVIPLDFEDLEFKIESIQSDTSLTLSEELENTFTARSARNKPQIPYRRKNRTWHVAGHKLRNPKATIDTGIQGNRFTVTDVSDLEDFFAGDLITVDGEQNSIRRIIGTQVVLNTVLQSGTPSGGEILEKVPVRRVFFTGDQKKGAELVFTRDWTLTNGTSDAFITFDDLAEFNITRPRLLGGTVTFSPGSRVVTASGVDLVAENIRPRDFIKPGLSDSPTDQDWLEVLQVDSETQLTLRTAFGGAGVVNAVATDRKSVEYIGDDTLITCQTLGKENSLGEWIKTPSNAVKDLLESVGLGSELNTSSFDQADLDAPFKMSMALPVRSGSDAPQLKQAITLINESVFGALFNDAEFKLFYQVLSPEKPALPITIKDDDVTQRNSFSVSTKSNIFRKTIGKYRPFDADRFTGAPGTKVVEYSSDFASRLVETTAEKVLNIYLFDQKASQTIVERFSYCHSLSQTTIKFKTKLDFIDLKLGDKVLVEFDRLFKRFGQESRQKFCVIIGITRTGEGIDFTLTDLGNIFNRSANVTNNTSLEFLTADNGEKIQNGYVVDNSTALPDNGIEEMTGINLIG